MPTPKPDTTTDLILIRHGETAWNRELRFQGHADVPLNDIGHEQARRLGLRLAGETVVQHILSSDLMRAQQTAAPAASQLSLPVVTSAGLREQFFGVVEGMRSDEIQSLHPRAWEEWLEFREDHAMPEGETAREFHTRIIAALGSIAAAHKGQHLIVVTHGGVLDMVWRTARGLSLSGPRQSDIPNAGFNRIRIADAARPDDIEIVEWADTRHLADLPPQPTYDQTRHLKNKD
ncbi:probable phosphoglycerate mutase [Variovorax sp. YR634]|jgi:probable phosphoglycerate mutase|uniref:histidine phosphatase family protein n=1 Tax=Variovorax TaxID=34072 RepID=UPI00089A9470|nr:MULTISPECIES: histidine phosphatase family protein [Variovorax]MDQ0084517.1 putative phosphoglycerate mutase [Variovorax boronicumulans]SDZ46717.1 probable phosphoglycerate mutase [Variovorax sp. YR634]SDZ62344.1 probable phosphoglycerate mutase [Variovorax sp. YR266]